MSAECAKTNVESGETCLIPLAHFCVCRCRCNVFARSECNQRKADDDEDESEQLSPFVGRRPGDGEERNMMENTCTRCLCTYFIVLTQFQFLSFEKLLKTIAFPPGMKMRKRPRKSGKETDARRTERSLLLVILFPILSLRFLGFIANFYFLYSGPNPNMLNAHNSVEQAFGSSPVSSLFFLFLFFFFNFANAIFSFCWFYIFRSSSPH